jgi:nucleoside-diphosphate-sugar epimerase
MKRAIVFGCGFVGCRTARLLAGAGWEAIGVTRSPESAAALASEPFTALSCDISSIEALAAAKSLYEPDLLISAVSSGRGGEEAYRAVYLQGIENAIDLLRPGRIIFVSSTSVYGQNDGSWVTESSRADPASPTSRILREAEIITFAHGGIAARLAGIYGPGRSVLLRKFLNQTAVIEGDGSRYINQIHADDAASALLLIAEKNPPAGPYNVVDDTPVSQLECYQWMAAALDQPMPPHGPIDPARKRGVTSKRISNGKLRALGWVLRYPSFQVALQQDAALLAAARADGIGDAPP